MDDEIVWPIPPVDGYCAEDLDTIRDLPSHTELIDGGLVFAAPQTVFRRRVLRAVEGGLEAALRPDLAVQRAMTVTPPRITGSWAAWASPSRARASRGRWSTTPAATISRPLIRSSPR